MKGNGSFCLKDAMRSSFNIKIKKMASQLTNNVTFIISSYSRSLLYQEMTLSVPLTDGHIRIKGSMSCLCSRTTGNGRWNSLQDIGIHYLLSGLISQATTDLPKAPQTLFPALHLLESVKHVKSG